VKNLFKFLGLSILFLTLGACSKSKVEENGNITTKALTVPFFRTVHIDGNFIVDITSGDTVQSVQVTASSNIVPLVQANVNSQILRLRIKRGYTIITKQPVMIKIGLKDLRALSVEGSSQATAAGINARLFELVTNGTARATLSGQANQIDIRVSGAGLVDASKLKASNASINISGSGNVHVFASNELIANISGSGNVVYAGNPKSVRQRSSGAGRIHSER
jgi:hypothetical protein